MLKESTPSSTPELGFAVAISGDTAIAGGPFDYTPQPNSGAAYIFTNTCDQWVQIDQQKASTPGFDDKFGWSVGISGDTAIVGATEEDTTQRDSGAAYIFERNTGGANQWSLVKLLKASSPGFNSWFGWSVGISGSTAIVGAIGESTHPISIRGGLHL